MIERNRFTCRWAGGLLFLLAVCFLPALSNAQDQGFTGTVTDSLSGDPLPGVSVTIKGTSVAVSTDLDGKFELPAEQSTATLVVSFLGYLTKEAPAESGSPVNIAIAQDVASLDQVVVIGYGTQRAQDVTGSVSPIKMANLEGQVVTGVDQALSGQLAGVQVSSSNGIPGGGPQIKVRGIGAVGAGSQPLYVIDGFAIPSSSSQISNPMNSINPNDIESITVLKDASATAIYGSRGANGVVVINTKRGAAGKALVQVSASTGIQAIPRKGRPDLMNAQEFAQFRKEAIGDQIRFEENREPTLDDIPEAYRNPEQLGEGTNWFDEVTESAPVSEVNVSVSGGSETFRSYVSAGYLSQEGVMLNTGYERFSARANLNATISDKISLGASIAPTFSTKKGGARGEGRAEAFGIASPVAPARLPDGSLNPYIESPGTFGLPNPIMLLTEVTDNTKTTRLLMNVFGEYNILENLQFKTTFNVDWEQYAYEYFKPSHVGAENTPPPSIPSSIYRRGGYTNWLNENTLTYKYASDNGHSFTGLVGYTVQQQKTEVLGVGGANYPDNDIRPINGAATITNNGTDKNEWALISYLARVNYSYKDKYIATATIRSDGSSRFGPENRWGTFPSFAVAWRMSEENFMENANSISDLKLRASYGFSGNFNIGNYSYMSNIGTGDYVLNGTLVGGRLMSTLGNSFLGWEKMRELNIGVDLGLFNDRVYLTADFYKRNTEDLLLDVEIPESSGFGTVLENRGDVQNTGVELAINSQNIAKEDFSWSTNFNISFNKNKVLGLGRSNAPIYSGESSEGNPTNISVVGQPLAMLYGYMYDGIYQNWDEVNAGPAFPGAVPGNMRFVDIDGDGVINPRLDFTVIGDPYPDFTWGLTNTLNYRNFDLRIMAVGSVGAEMIHATNDYMGNLDGVFNVRKDIAERWRSEQDPGSGLVPTTNGSGRGRVMYRDVHSLTVEKTDYAWIKNFTLGYTLPNGIGGEKGISNARIYLNIQNALLITNFSGNPEGTNYLEKGGSGALVPGVDYSNYPIPRTFSLGVNLTF